MQESPFFQRQREKFIEQGTKEATLKSLRTVLNAKFHVEAVRAIDPALQDIDDLQRLEQLLLTAVNAENLDAFTKILFE
jgi:DNA-binding protein YbaB